MDIIKKKIKDLIAADYNPRKIKDEDFEQLKKSLEKFEAVEPAIINSFEGRENIIVGGHQRIKAAKSLGWKEFPCVVVNLDLEQEKELNVRLNKNTGQFDFDILANEFNTDDLVDWGFEGWQLGMETDLDYSILEDSEATAKAEEMANDGKKAVMIEFELAHYDEALSLIKFWRERDAYIGYMVLEFLRKEREKVESKRT